MFYSIPLVLVGYQAIWFDRIEEYFVRFAGYLPGDLRRTKKFNLELWLIAGGLFFLIGGGILAAIFIKWVMTQFGPLRQVRLGAFAILMIVLGSQTMMNALVIGMMDIKVERKNS